MVSVVAGNILFVCIVSVVGFVYGFRRGRITFCFYGFRRRIFDGFCRRTRIQHFRTYRVIPRCLGFQDWFPSLVCLWFPSWQEQKRFVMVSVVGFCYCFLRGRKQMFCYGFRQRLFMVSVVARNVCLYGFRRWFCYGFLLLQDHGSLSDGNHTTTIRTFP